MYIIEIGDGYGIEVQGELMYRAVPNNRATRFATEEEAFSFINKVSLRVIFSDYFITKV